MFRARNEKAAKSLAGCRELLYGLSVTEGGWFVGTFLSLIDKGVMEVQNPNPAKENALDTALLRYLASYK